MSRGADYYTAKVITKAIEENEGCSKLFWGLVLSFFSICALFVILVYVNNIHSEGEKIALAETKYAISLTKDSFHGYQIIKTKHLKIDKVKDSYPYDRYHDGRYYLSGEMVLKSFDGKKTESRMFSSLVVIDSQGHRNCTITVEEIGIFSYP